MSTATPSDGLSDGLIKVDEMPDDCPHCDGKLIVENGIRHCKECLTTPAGNYLGDYDEPYEYWPYPKCGENNSEVDAYDSYSVRCGRKRRKLNGGHEEAYKNPENGHEYCIDKDTYESNPHHEDLIIWG